MHIKWIRGGAVLWGVSGVVSAMGAAGQPANNLPAALTAMTKALEARDIKAVMQRVAPDFVLENAGGGRLDRRQFEQIWERTLQSMADLKVTYTSLLSSGRGREVTFQTDFHIDGHTQAMPLPLTITRLESGAIRTIFADPQHSHYIVYVGSVEQTWTQTRQGWKLKRQRILREKRTVDPRPFTLPLQPGGAADREVETLTPTSSASGIEGLFDFNPTFASTQLPARQPDGARPRNRP